MRILHDTAKCSICIVSNFRVSQFFVSIFNNIFFCLVLNRNSVNLKPSPMWGTVFRWWKMRFWREIRCAWNWNNREVEFVEQVAETKFWLNVSFCPNEHNFIAFKFPWQQEVNSLILSCSQALVREQQKTGEVSRLQEVINKILREAGKRTREEVQTY